MSSQPFAATRSVTFFQAGSAAGGRWLGGSTTVAPRQFEVRVLVERDRIAEPVYGPLAVICERIAGRPATDVHGLPTARCQAERIQHARRLVARGLQQLA